MSIGQEKDNSNIYENESEIDYINLLIGENIFRLDKNNTVLMTFSILEKGVSPGIYDHLRFHYPDGGFGLLSLAKPRRDEMKLTAMEYGFPHYHLPTLDDVTIEWFTSIEAQEITDTSPF